MPTTGLLNPVFLAKLEALRLSVRRVRWGSRMGGRFAISRRGSSIEFADYAAYTPGDDIRSIDWKLYARLDRLFVKTYKEEVELSVEVIVDATTSMGLPSIQKFERAVQLGLVIAYIGFAGRHQVRMSWVKPGAPLATPRFFHRVDITKMKELGEGIMPEGSVILSEWMRTAAATFRMRGGQSVLISDGMYRPADFFQALHALMIKHLEVKVIQVLSPNELHPARLFQGGMLVDSETGFTHELAYSPAELEGAILEHNEGLARFCTRNAIPFAQHRLDEPIEDFVLKTLPARGFLE